MALQQRSTGRRIAELRERAHLTQEVAADRAGVTLRAYQKWEAGGGIQYANLEKLALALNVRVEQITGEAETPSPFRLSDQIADVDAAFRSDVDEIKTRLDGIEERLQALDIGGEIAEQLKIQMRILNRIEAYTKVLDKVRDVVSEPAATPGATTVPAPDTHAPPLPGRSVPKRQPSRKAGGSTGA